MIGDLETLNREIRNCIRCSRLVAYREKVSQEKRFAFRYETYWGRPLPGFGDPQAKLLIVGLAPAAHGGNRTGRMFTGDRSGNFLFAALHRAKFANQPASVARDDRLRLTQVYITNAVRCAPPENRPTNAEQKNCLPYLINEIKCLPRLRLVLALGKLAFGNVLNACHKGGVSIPKPKPQFAHGIRIDLESLTLVACYHPSQRNTQTGLLTPAMMDQVLMHCKEILEQPEPGKPPKE